MDIGKFLRRLFGLDEPQGVKPTDLKPMQQTGYRDAPGGGYLPDYSANPQYRYNVPIKKAQYVGNNMPSTNMGDDTQLDNSNSSENLGQKILKGLRAQLGKKTPIEDYIPQFVDAANKYPFFKQNPYLLPQLSILETSGGQNVTRPNNFLNWGINYPGNNDAFSKMKPEDVLDRAISGLGERDPNYTNIRQTNDLMQFAKTYEPANPDYYNNLVKGMQVFQSQ